MLQSLEQLHTQLSEVDVDYDEVESLSEGHKTALYASVALVKQMLSETQVGGRVGHHSMVINILFILLIFSTRYP